MKKIPMVKWYTVRKNGCEVQCKKLPLYTLHSRKEELKKQKELGNMLGYYYGTDCDKCCGVYPKFFHTQGFEELGYYVCLVCGKESKHAPMPWQAREYWNSRKYEWEPERQLTFEDLLSEDM
jgi:hypothetical protein